ncbi:matrixin family metalloprotease [Glaciecola sp. MH2013]|uniref:matrixin family metalloprotease n=1 Tax=Glaciecola sp. MH2013 TaxID=2785524 RepID=UPI00189DEAF7|nr:matrixin family metalloprotease [Glaciecola sp. MH2013]MBF7073514.1 matrixin family metalloprotease [Glaciecola sp. MH2013]
MKKLILCTAALLASSVAIAQQQTGRQLDIISAGTGETTVVPSIDPNFEFIVRPIVGIFWDARCANVEYTFNTAQSANPGQPEEILPEQLAAVVQQGLDRWNANPSSYINMNVTQLTDLGDRPRVGGDFINEVTFITPEGFDSLASSPSTTLQADATFVAGDDLDGDGDSDVFDPVEAGINVCTDIDDDGDIEFPAGDYAAGTILDNDVQFSTTVRWELEPTDGGLFADVDAVSVHEFGHSHGLNHATINQISSEDGTGSTMFPFIDTGDANAELGTRSLHSDDLAASAFIYQEGSNDAGELPKLQAGDVAFADAYSVVRGSVKDANGNPVGSAAVQLDNRRTKSAVAMTYSGKAVVFGDPAGGLFAFDESIVDGDWAVPVPTRTLYTASIEALDGDPVATGNISTAAIVAGIVGQNTFPEEGFTFDESGTEIRSSSANPFWTGRFAQTGIDFVTNTETVQRNAGPTQFIGTGAIFGASDIIYAEVFDRDAVSELIANGDIPISGVFETGTLDASLVPQFTKATLAIGRIDPETRTLELTRTIRTIRNIVGQDGDGTVVPFVGAEGIPFQIRGEFNRDPNAQLVLVLEANDLEAGPSGFPPAFVRVDTTRAGSSFLSVDESPLFPFNSTFSIEMRYVNNGGFVSPYLTDF